MVDLPAIAAGAFNSNDRPGDALEKLYVMRREHFITGKEFDEAKIRRVYGLPEVATPEFLPERADRRAATLRNDAQAAAEVAEAERQMRASLAKDSASQLESAVAQQKLGEQADYIKELESRLARIEAGQAGANKGEAKRPKPPRPTTEKVAPASGDLPNEKWTTQQMVEWAAAHSYPKPEGKGYFGRSRKFVLDHVLTQHQLAEAGGDAEEEEPAAE